MKLSLIPQFLNSSIRNCPEERSSYGRIRFHMSFDLSTVSDEEIRREKEKARRLRRSHWWNSRIEKGICHYCNHEVGRENLTMDHVVPLARGGKSKKGNLVPACKECNNRKKSLLPVEWEEYLEASAHFNL